MPARMTPLATGIPPVNLDQGAPVPGGFVLQLANELAPADIVNGFRQCRMLDHRLHMQALHANRLVLTDDAGREFVQEIAATISNAGVNTGDFPARFVAVLGATLLLGQTPLRLSQLLLILSKEAGVAHLLARIQTTTSCKPDQCPTCLASGWQRRNRLFQQDADEVASGGIPADGDGGGVAPSGKGRDQ